MSLELFFTAQTTPATTPTKAVSGPGTAAAGVRAPGFLDVLLTQLLTAQKESGGTEQALQSQRESHAPLRSDNPLLEKSPQLDVSRLLADTAEIAEKTKTTLAPDLELTEVLALNEEAGLERLISLEKEAAESPAEFSALFESFRLTPEDAPHDAALGAIQKTLSRLEKLAAEGKPDFILSNLTPAQIKQLQDFIQNPEGADETDFSETDFALLAGLVTLTPPHKQQIQTHNRDSAAPGQAPAPSLAKPLETLNSLNALIVGGDTNKKLEMIAARAGDVNAQNGKFDDAGASASHGKPASADAPANSAALPPGAGKASAELSLLQNFSFPLLGLSGALLGSMNSAPAGSFESLLEEMGLSGQNAHAMSPGSLSSLVTQAQSAAQPHPATQMVAATLQKAARAGQTTHINIQLDPPELGRIEVRMQFDKNNILKATLMAEKPETHMMMQRDSQILERALQEAGIETDGDISFELAQDRQDFNQNGSHDGQGPYGRSRDDGENAENAEDVIYTTMNWSVDPETGHTHYNIIA